jgi:TrfA protein
VNNLVNIQERIEHMRDKARRDQMRLPFDDWAEELRAAPNELLRSGIFGVVCRGRRRYVEEMNIPAPEGFRIAYTGKRLDQADLDIWLQLLHMLRTKTVDDEIRFSVRWFLKQLERNVGKSDRDWLDGRMTGLVASATRIEDKKGRVLITGGLIRAFGYDPETSEAVVHLNEHLRKLFDNYTLIRWEDRLALGSDQLAKWLHAYYSTHAEAYPLKVETILKACGSEVKLLRHFRAELRSALDTLKGRGLILDWQIGSDDLVHVQRKPTITQARHLSKARARDSADAQGG